MLYKKLYKLNSDNETIQSWEVHFENDSYWTVSGQLEGKKVTSKPTLVVPKVSRTLTEQLELEMNSIIKVKRDKKYVDDVNKVKNAEQDLDGYSPMLAKKWEEHKHKIKFPCIVQPKLDGVRCLITKDGMFSRNRQRYTSCQHIWEALTPLFVKFPDAKLDGELYSHDLKDNFEEIISAARKSAEHATDEDIARQQKLKYYIYDVAYINHNYNQNTSFKDRFNALIYFFNTHQHLKNIVVLETHNDIKSEEEIIKLHDQFVEDGYEGAMIRNTDMPYEGKRSHNLLKLKNFQDAEFEILGVNEGKGNLAGHAGTFTVKLNEEQTFNAKLTGKIERLKWIFEHQHEVIGKMATIRYQNLTKDGVPRFCVCKSVRGLQDRSDWL